MPANPRMTAIGHAAFGTGDLTTDLSLGAGWAINLAVAEYVIRRRGGHPTISRRSTGTVKVGSS